MERQAEFGIDAADLAWDLVFRALSDFRDAGGDAFDLHCTIRNAVMVEVNRAMVDVNRAILARLGDPTNG